MEITIDFNGNLVIFVVWLLTNWLVNVIETFTYIRKHYFLQTNATELVTCML